MQPAVPTGTPADDETERLASLQRFRILDTPPDEAFDRVSTLAARFFKTPIALISLVDEDRIWYKSKFGIDMDQVVRSPGLCASVIMSDGAYVVKNAAEDPRTRAHPLVTGDFGLRFYAGAPLVTVDGFRLGAIGVIDLEPREFSREEEDALIDFAGIIMDQLEVRLSALQSILSFTKILGVAQSTFNLEKVVTVCAWTKKIKVDQKWISFEDFLTQALGLTVSHGIEPTVAQEALRELASERSTGNR